MSEQGRAMALCTVLAMAVVVTAIACVYARHESRSMFTSLQSLEVQRDALEVDWGRLQIEQSTWSTHSRVERLARSKMQMRNPAAGEVQVVRQ
jgi:cell division protein FtsL